MLKIIFSVLLLLSMGLQSKAQEHPDLSKIPVLGDKIEALRVYLNLLLTETNDYKKTIAVGKEAMAITPADSTRVKAMFNLFIGCAYENTKQYDSAIYFLNQCITLSRPIGKIKYEITALSRLDNIYSYQRNTAERKNTIARMVQIADTSSKPEIKELAVSALGGYYRDINDYENAIKYKIREIELKKAALKLDTLTQDPINIGYSMMNLANLFNEIGQHQKAIDYLNEATPYVADRALTGNEENYYTYFIQAFLGLNKKDSAQYYYNLTNKKMASRDTLFATMSSQNYFFGNYFLEYKMTDSAYQYALLSKKYGARSEGKSEYIQASALLGDVYFAQRKYAACITEMRLALQNNFEFDRQQFAGINKSMAASFAALKQWDSAYIYYNNFAVVNDSLQAAVTNKNFADAEAQYQNKEKKQQLLLNDLELKSSRRQAFWLIAGLVLAGLLAFSLIVIYRNKKRTADLLDDKNKKLSVLNDQLEEANRTKAKLFSILGHDLRSPISQVYQFLKLQQLNPEALNAEQKERLNTKIQTATGSLLETMEDLLLWSKTQMGSFSTTIEKLELLPVVNACEQLLQLNIEAKKISIQKDIDTGALVNSDTNYLQTIVRNLLQNAIKASPEGGLVKLEFEIRGMKPVLSIANSGNSFTRKQYLQIMEKENDAKSLDGLGLRLVTELAEKAGIQINFLNEDNGTMVELHFP